MICRDNKGQSLSRVIRTKSLAIMAAGLGKLTKIGCKCTFNNVLAIIRTVRTTKNKRARQTGGEGGREGET